MAAPRIRLPSLVEVESAVKAITQFLGPASHIVNSHLNSYFVDSLWEKLPEKLRQDLNNVTVQDLKEQMKTLTVPCEKELEIESFTGPRFSENIGLAELLQSVRSLLLRSLRMSIPYSEFSTVLQSRENMLLKECQKVEDAELHRMREDLWKMNTCLVMMSPKKLHEVKNMSEFVATFSKYGSKNMMSGDTGDEVDVGFNVHHLIDLGSGKGYLSSILTLLHKMKVLAIDSSQVNTHGCEKRSNSMLKMLPSLIERTKNPNFAESEFRRRGKNWRSKEKVRKMETEEVNQSSNEPVVGDERGTSENDRNSNLKTVTLFVSEGFRYDDLLLQHFPDYQSEGVADSCHFGLIGLHTCGQLGVDSLKIFSSAESAKFIINVPCCLHLVNEAYCEPGHKNLVIPDIDDFLPGFPLSNYLNGKEFTLGRNARMMCAQSIHRICSETDDEKHSRPILHRAILGMIFRKLTGYVHVERNVGRIGLKYPMFLEYVRKALTRVHLDHLPITDSEIQQIYDEYAVLEDQLCKYVLVRSLFAPLVEGLMLLDRLAYLLEQEHIKNAFIVEIFDPFISPRCHALVAVK